MQRSAFSRQPAHVVLVDLHGQMDSQTGRNISRALEEFFAIVCSLAGPCRVPFFGLFTLSETPQVLFPLQHVRSNFARLQTSLLSLQSVCDDTRLGGSGASCVGQGLTDAIAMFTKQAQNLMQTAGYWSQLEVTVLTTRCPASVIRQLEKACKVAMLDSVKRIKVVSISSSDHQMAFVDDLVSSSQGSSPSDTNSSSDSSSAGLTESTIIENDVLSMGSFFKAWLHDCSTDSEHLQLLFPATLDDTGDAEKLVRCDLHERVINPFQLPFQGKAALTLDGQIVRPSVASGGKGGSLSLPVFRLRVVERVPVDSICESVLFGQPVVVRATSCWKMDWDELENNRQFFHALCSALHQQNEALLAYIEVTEEQGPASRRGLTYPASIPQPRGHFMLMPSPSGTLLLKAVAMSEMMLPVDLGPPETVSEDNKAEAATMLNQVKVNMSFNPMQRTGNLHDSLTYHLTKRLPNSAKPNQSRRKTQSVSSRPRTSPTAQTLTRYTGPYAEKRTCMPRPGRGGKGRHFPTVL